MALKVKSALLQVRLDPDLLARFREIYEGRGFTVSEAVRRFMEHQVKQADSAQYASEQALKRTE